MLAAGVVCVSAAAGCWDDGTGPEAVPRAQLALLAPFRAGSVLGIVPVSDIHLRLVRANGEVAIDTTVVISADADSTYIELSVPLLLTAPTSPPRERLELTATIADAGGTTLFVAGPDTIEAVASGGVVPLVTTMRYVGPGASAQSIAVSPGLTTIVGGDTVQFSAQAVDGSGQPVLNAPIVWLSLDTAVAVVQGVTNGQVVSRLGPGTARIVARLLNGPADTSLTTVLGPPTNIAVVSGDAQTAEVDVQLPIQPRVRVTDALGAPRPGLTVDFVVSAGGGLTTGSAQVTDSLGEASLGSWTLGPTATVNTIDVRVQGATLGTLTASATWRRRVKSFYETACAVNSANAVLCWGNNANGDYGALPAVIPSSTSPVVVPASSLVELAEGHGRHTCGIAASRAATCWGRREQGQLGGGSIPGTGPVTVAGGISWRQISTSILSSCGVSTAGTAYCWGSNQRGEVGSTSVPLNAQSPTPIPVDGGLVFASVAAGWLHACGVTTAGDAYCWGDNRNGQLGIPTSTVQSRVPVLVTGGHRFERLAAGTVYTCGITTTKQAVCWGANAGGQLGDGTTTSRATPTPVVGGHRFSHIAAGVNIAATSGVQLGVSHTCALTEDGEPWCWGDNQFGQLGDGTTTTSLIPIAVGGGLRLSGLSIGTGFTCGMRGEAIWCWGWNGHGRLGAGSTTDRNVPNPIGGGLTLTSVGLGNTHACGLDAAGASWCWGDNATGQLGDGTVDRRTTPTPTTGAPAFTDIQGGFTHTCALSTGGSVWCWGFNGSGQLGDGTNTSRPSATQVSGAAGMVGLGVGWNHACAWTAAGVASCWGLGTNNALGNGSTSIQTAPVAVSGGIAFSSISGGAFHSCGFNGGGGAFCWGTNSVNQLGDGTNAMRSTPVGIGPGLNFASISAGQSHTCGVTLAGSAYCWGGNFSGGIGDGTTTQRSTPTAVLGGLTFASVSVGTGHSCGLTTAGSAWCWGSNDRGALGDGGNLARTSPVAVAGGLTFTTLRAGGEFTCGITTGGTTYCWGANDFGQLGDGVMPAPPARVSGF